MSSPNKYTLALSPEAQEDYEDILAYTERQWGVEQMGKYDTLLDKALLALETNPRKGRRHVKLPEALRYYPVGRHNIVFRVEAKQIEVVRILHDRMDMGRHI